MLLWNLGLQEYEGPPERLVGLFLSQAPHPGFAHQKNERQKNSQVEKVGKKPRQSRCAKIRTTLYDESLSLVFSQNKGWSHCIVVHSLLYISHQIIFCLFLTKAGLDLAKVCTTGGLIIRRFSVLSYSVSRLCRKECFLGGGCNSPVPQWWNTPVLQCSFWQHVPK